MQGGDPVDHIPRRAFCREVTDLLPLDDPSTEPDEGAPDKVAADLAKWVK